VLAVSLSDPPLNVRFGVVDVSHLLCQPQVAVDPQIPEITECYRSKEVNLQFAEKNWHHICMQMF